MASYVTGHKLCVSEKEYNIYALCIDNYTIIMTADREYQQRVAFSMLDYIYQKMNDTLDLDDIIKKYQNLTDEIYKIQKTIDATKCIMVDAIDKVLERGEKIDDLVSKSNDLSEGSKLFYKETKKMNSCCIIQ